MVMGVINIGVGERREGEGGKEAGKGREGESDRDRGREREGEERGRKRATQRGRPTKSEKTGVLFLGFGSVLLCLPGGRGKEQCCIFYLEGTDIGYLPCLVKDGKNMDPVMQLLLRGHQCVMRRTCPLGMSKGHSLCRLK